LSIYRGAGGAGDAVADSSSEALLIRELVGEAQVSATSATTSATAAGNSASAAATSASNAATSATNAETAETNAELAETGALAAQAAAEAAQAAAETAQAAAELAETNAETAETNAAASATAAQTAETGAETAQAAAELAETNAETAQAAAEAAQLAAETAETNAQAAQSAAETAQTGAETAETNAETAETGALAAQTAAEAAQLAAETAQTAAELAETNAETAETNAAASASAAATSESNAATSASNAATSETNAATSETNAATSASAAATAESNAAASAAAAAASYDNFDDRYLGAKSAAPTLDNDGDALVAGALYYNDGTVTPADKGMYVYDGSVWIAASAASEAILTVFKYTATAGQTTFTGADDNSLTLTYTAGSVIITVNGAVMEVGTDVTATNGTSIVLTSASNVGDEVNIYAFATFNVANTYTQAEADARFFNVTGDSISGNLTFTGTGNRITGDFSNATAANRVVFQSSTTNGNTVIDVIPNGTATTTSFILNTDSAITNGSFAQVLGANNEISFRSGIRGTGSYQPMTFYTGGSERLRIDTSGSVGIGTSTLAPNSLTLNNTRPLVWLNSSGTVSGGTTGTQLLKFSDNNFYIDNYDSAAIIFRRNSFTESMRIDSSGNLFVGYTTGGSSTSGVVRAVGYNCKTGFSGALTVNGFNINWTGSAQLWIDNTNVGTITLTSDYRVKRNIETLTTPALERLMALRPVTYQMADYGNLYKAGEEIKEGFIAHEVQEVIPSGAEGVKDDENQIQSLRVDAILAVAVKAIQELKATVDAQAARIAALEGTV
jgi:hypothetical protein